jgi:hypothetical protein
MIRKMARPSKLTDKVCDDIVTHIKAGNYPATAAGMAGIGESTFYQWKKWGRERKSGKFVEFLEKIKKAENFGEALRVKIILESAIDKGNWQAAAWYLERRYPDRWGRRNRVEMEHSGRVEKEVKGELKIEVSDESRKLAAELSRSIHSKNDRSPKPGGD